MNDLLLAIFKFLPQSIYQVIVISLVLLILFWKQIPILNWIKIKVSLPEEFMRNFRWITPLIGGISLAIDIVSVFILYHMLMILRAIAVKVGA